MNACHICGREEMRGLLGGMLFEWSGKSVLVCGRCRADIVFSVLRERFKDGTPSPVDVAKLAYDAARDARSDLETLAGEQRKLMYSLPEYSSDRGLAEQAYRRMLVGIDTAIVNVETKWQEWQDAVFSREYKAGAAK